MEWLKDGSIIKFSLGQKCVELLIPLRHYSTMGESHLYEVSIETGYYRKKSLVIESVVANTLKIAILGFGIRVRW